VRSTVAPVWAIAIAVWLGQSGPSNPQRIAAANGAAVVLQPRPLPAALGSLVAEPVRLVSAVVADIDADGDLDLVAADVALQLHVWINDGRGHFTPKPAAQPAARWHGEPAGPSVDARPIESRSSTQNDPPTVCDAAPIAYMTRASEDALSRGANPPNPTSRFSRCPRAPPASVSA